MNSKLLQILYILHITFFSFSCLVLLTSCAHTPKPTQFDTAIRTLAQDLLKQVNDHHDDSDQSTANIVIDPFFDANSGEVLNVSKQIEAILLEEQQKSFPRISLKPLRSHTLTDAQYILRGEIRLDHLKLEETDQKSYHVLASVDNRKRVVAQADVWVSDKNLDYTGAGIHTDTPMFIIDPLREKARAIIESRVKAHVESESAAFLETKAILVEAGDAYENKDYRKALRLFQQAARQDDGVVG